MAATRRTSTDIALIAGFAALVAACALLPGVPVGPLGVPITLQTFAVMLAGAVLGSTRGFLAVALYVVAGLAGLPIFSGGASGLGVLAGPTAGYLLAFAPAAWLCGAVVERLPRHQLATSVPLVFLAGWFSSLALIHTCGIAVLVTRFDLTWSEAFLADLPFWPGDVVKNLVMAVVATAVHRAFPDLLPRRTGREPVVPTHEPA